MNRYNHPNKKHNRAISQENVLLYKNRQQTRRFPEGPNARQGSSTQPNPLHTKHINLTQTNTPLMNSNRTQHNTTHHTTPHHATTLPNPTQSITHKTQQKKKSKQHTRKWGRGYNKKRQERQPQNKKKRAMTYTSIPLPEASCVPTWVQPLRSSAAQHNNPHHTTPHPTPIEPNRTQHKA